MESGQIVTERVRPRIHGREGASLVRTQLEATIQKAPTRGAFVLVSVRRVGYNFTISLGCVHYCTIALGERLYIELDE